MTQLTLSAETRHVASLVQLQKLARVMDSNWRIPFTRVRFGADSLLGLIPGVGDAIGMGISLYALVLAQRMGAPKSLLFKMLANSAIDAGVGAIPLVGDVFDVFFKSNTKNLKLVTDFIEQK